ncbi:MAG: AAA family ATPase [Lachnospiraceae bacterium]
MQPIRLEIKGLNSFKDIQRIEFEPLTQMGLFGIFGPTGSGKSTILDGITLALYGEVARKSNFINSSMDRANVSFQFRMNGKQCEEYCAEREYRIDKKSGNPRAGKCHLYRIGQQGERVVLADKPSEIDRKCREIIGLKYDDFVRTVVLPQGKFSEFLKLEGSARRNMLERLFHLEEYGEELMGRVKQEINQAKSEQDKILGELNRFQNVSEDTYKIHKKESETVKANLVRYEKEEVRILADYQQKQEIWFLQEEQKQYLKALEQLKAGAEQLEIQQTQLERAKQAEQVRPWIEEWNITSAALQKAKNQVEQVQIDYEREQQQLKGAEKEKAEAEAQESRIPELCVQLQQIESAQKEWAVYQQLQTEKEDLERQEKRWQKSEADYLKKKQDFLEEQQSKEAEKDTLQRKLEETTIDITYRMLIQEGVMAEKNLLDAQRKWNNQENEYASKVFELERRKEEEETAWQQAEQAKRDWEQCQENRNQLKEPYTECEIEEQTEKVNQLHMRGDQIVEQLRKGLVEGEHCPVCGGLVHVENFLLFDSVAQQKEIVLEETRLQQMKQESRDYAKKVQLLDKECTEQEKHYHTLQTTWETMQYRRQITEKEIEHLSSEWNKIQLEYDAAENVLVQCQQKWQALYHDWKESDGQINGKQVSFPYKESFAECQTRVNQQDQQSVALQKQWKQMEDFMEKSNKKIQQLDRQIQEAFCKKVEYRQSRQMKMEQMACSEERMQDLLRVFDKGENGNSSLNGDYESLKKKYTRIKREIAQIQEMTKRCQQQWSQAQQQLDESKGKLITWQTKKNQLQETESKQAQKVKEQCELYSFAAIEDVEASYLDEKTQNAYRQAWEDYQSQFQRSQANLETVCRKLNQRSVTLEQWQEIQQQRECIKMELQNLRQRDAELNVILQQMNDDLKQKKKLQKREAELEHHMSMLRDLESIFKGKQFVEFIAAERLNYIAMEASKRLSEITGGNYELETGNNGEFLIVDNKNGGVRRHPATLSGGETFTTSLALALALSSQIQLSHSTSLELFFLDEGFGSLDEELLGVVMDALEHVHHAHLKVGLISHVESVKQRVPVKLVVTPAQMGGSGSTVKLELS